MCRFSLCAACQPTTPPFTGLCVLLTLTYFSCTPASQREKCNENATSAIRASPVTMAATHLPMEDGDLAGVANVRELGSREEAEDLLLGRPYGAYVREIPVV